MTLQANILWIIWISSAVALVFWVMHYYVAAWLAGQPMTQSLGSALAIFFPGS